MVPHHPQLYHNRNIRNKRNSRSSSSLPSRGSFPAPRARFTAARRGAPAGERAGDECRDRRLWFRFNTSPGARASWCRGRVRGRRARRADRANTRKKPDILLPEEY